MSGKVRAGAKATLREGQCGARRWVEVTWLDELMSAPVSTSVPPPFGKLHVDEDGMENVGLKAPVKARFPLSVTVKDPLLTPVPP